MKGKEKREGEGKEKGRLTADWGVRRKEEDERKKTSEKRGKQTSGVSCERDSEPQWREDRV